MTVAEQIRSILGNVKHIEVQSAGDNEALVRYCGPNPSRAIDELHQLEDSWRTHGLTVEHVGFIHPTPDDPHLRINRAG
jgi:hypothetical protein